MALIYDPKTGAHLIRRGGVVIGTLEAARFDSALDDRSLEDEVKAELESKASLVSRACVVLIHIRSRSPLTYDLLVGPPGYAPAFSRWWEVQPEVGATGSLTPGQEVGDDSTG
jgi:hypothetical protein